MDISPASIFDVQKLALEQVSRSQGYITALQKPLRRAYFPYKKNLAINPPLPYHKIVAGPQGIAFSPASPSAVISPMNTLPSIEKSFPKESIISAVAVQFSFHGKNKKFKGAFVTLDKEERIKQAKEYSDLFTSIDEKDMLLTTAEHSAIFICITKSNASKQFDAHIFICQNEDQALDILKALKGQAKDSQISTSEIATSISSSATQVSASEPLTSHPQQPSYPPVFQGSYPMNPSYYSTLQPPNPVDSSFNGSCGQIFYNALNYPAIPGQASYIHNPNANPAQLPYGSNVNPHMYQPTQPSYYPAYPNFQNSIPQNHNNQSTNDGGSITIPRPTVYDSSHAPADIASTCGDFGALNLQMRLPRAVPTSQSSSSLNSMIPSGAPNIYPNVHTFPDQSFPQTQPCQFGLPRSDITPSFSTNQPINNQPIGNQPISYQPINNQLQPQFPNSTHLGIQAPYNEKPVLPPSSPLIGNRRIVSTGPVDDGDVRAQLAQKTVASGEQAEAGHVPNQMPAATKTEHTMPAVPPKPSKPIINNANCAPKQELKQPKRIIGVRVMPALPNPKTPAAPTSSNPLDETMDKTQQNQEMSG